MTLSALLIAVPEADSVVARWRDRLDRAATWGVSAHVTLLFPFAPPDVVDDRMRTELRALFNAIPAFDFVLESVKWFREDVVYLAPAPAGPFRALTHAIVDAFPDFPPYGGAYDDVIPHLTVGDGAPRADLEAAARDVRRHLPVACAAREVVLMAGTEEPNSWSVKERFSLAAGVT